MSFTGANVKLSTLNGHLICGLCGGYLIDATVLTECVHVFCRSCIVKYLTEHKVCPLCQSLIQETRPGHALRPDTVLQRVVYKLVPGLLKTEMQRLTEFCSSMSASETMQSVHAPESEYFLGTSTAFSHPPLPTALATRSLSRNQSALPTSRQISGKHVPSYTKVPSSVSYLLGEDEFISVALTHIPTIPDTQFSASKPLIHTFNRSCENETTSASTSPTPGECELETVYLLCPSVVTVQSLHHLILAKYQIDPHKLVVDFYLDGECLEPSHSLREVAFLYCFPAKHQRMCFEFIFADARLAWWGRPMPRLERSHNKDSHQLIWSPPLDRRRSCCSSPDSVDDVRPRQRAWSIASGERNREAHSKAKRTSL
ncbi:hypothetical protein CRM22_001950 [Opisthorchis felineus]|uniref:RING-type domain-containing protein n=1 Tax=Opisthorchis felineus TaxID=147828 RepID=A0A4S2M8E6_OPIFE|nr:hypothetical protein CRM22_001950 [Opisthorchis felineus]